MENINYDTRPDGSWYVKADGLELHCDGRTISIYKNNRLIAVRRALASPTARNKGTNTGRV